MEAVPQTFATPTKTSPPLLIWCVVVLLAIEGVGNLLAVPNQPIALWWLIAKVLIISGLLRGYRWMFYLFIALATYHAFYSWGMNDIAVLLNAGMALATLASWRYYFTAR